MDQSYRIVRFGPATKIPARDLAMLHARLLPRSALTRLGRRFLKKYHYRLLPRDGLIFGAVAYVGERPAGFVCATFDSRGFMRAALKRYFLRWAWALGTTLLFSPRAIAAVWELLRLMLARQMNICQGEILALGILPDYRDYRFTDPGGLHLANDLLDTVMEQFRERGIDTVRAVADSGNYIAHRYLRQDGAPDEGYGPDWRLPGVEFILRPAP